MREERRGEPCREPGAWCVWSYWIITKTPWYRINLFLLLKKVRLSGSEWLPQVRRALRGEGWIRTQFFSDFSLSIFPWCPTGSLDGDLETAVKCPDNQKSEESGEIYMGFPGRHEGPWAQAPAAGTSRPHCATFVKDLSFHSSTVRPLHSWQCTLSLETRMISVLSPLYSQCLEKPRTS